MENGLAQGGGQDGSAGEGVGCGECEDCYCGGVCAVSMISILSVEGGKEGKDEVR